MSKQAASFTQKHTVVSHALALPDVDVSQVVKRIPAPGLVAVRGSRRFSQRLRVKPRPNISVVRQHLPQNQILKRALPAVVPIRAEIKVATEDAGGAWWSRFSETRIGLQLLLAADAARCSKTSLRAEECAALIGARSASQVPLFLGIGLVGALLIAFIGTRGTSTPEVAQATPSESVAAGTPTPTPALAPELLQPRKRRCRRRRRPVSH